MLASSYFWGYTLDADSAAFLVDRFGLSGGAVQYGGILAGSRPLRWRRNLLDVFAARLIVPAAMRWYSRHFEAGRAQFTDQPVRIMSASRRCRLSRRRDGLRRRLRAGDGFGWRASFISSHRRRGEPCFCLNGSQPNPCRVAARLWPGVLSASGIALAIANGLRHDLAFPLPVVTTLSACGHSDGGAFFNISPSASEHSPAVVMVATHRFYLSRPYGSRAAALDTALIRNLLLRMMLIAMLLPRSPTPLASSTSHRVRGPRAGPAARAFRTEVQQAALHRDLIGVARRSTRPAAEFSQGSQP